MLTSPTMEQCLQVIHQLKTQHHTRWHITLDTSSPDILLTLLTDINKCLVKALKIKNTHFDSNCVSQLVQVITYNQTMEYLDLQSSPLLPDTYHLLTTALSRNKILKTLYLINDDNVNDNDIPHLCDLITNNKTLRYLDFTFCPNISKFGVQQIKNVLVKNNSLSRLYINGTYLRSS